MFLYAMQMKFQFIVYGFIARILNWLGSLACNKNVNYKKKKAVWVLLESVLKYVKEKNIISDYHIKH
jgi:hypothetical protein